MTQKVIDPVLFRQEMNALQKQAESCRMEIAQLEQETHGETEIIAELKQLLRFTEQHSAMLTEFSGDMVFCICRTNNFV